MSTILRAAALTLAAGSSLAVLAGPASAATAADNTKGTLMSCVYRNVAGTGTTSLTADGPDFRQATSGALAGTHCATWTVKVGQYTVDATENSVCTLQSATVTRDGRTHTFATNQNAAGGLFGLTNVAAGKTTRVDWVYATC